MGREKFLRLVRHIVAAALLGAGLATGAAAAGLDCGVANKAHAVDPALLTALRGAARDPGMDANAKAAIGRMVSEGLPKAEIVDRLVEAYCPVVASDPALNDPQRREAIRNFAGSVTDTVYAPADAPEAVILSLPVPPTVAEEIRAAAAKAGMTRADWIRDAVTDRLSKR